MSTNRSLENSHYDGARNPMLSVEVRVVDPHEMFIGGGDLRMQSALLDMVSGRLALTPEAQARGWPIFLDDDHLEVKRNGHSYWVHWVGHGPEPWHADAAWSGMYDIQDIRKHGDSIILDTSDGAFNRLCSA